MIRALTIASALALALAAGAGTADAAAKQCRDAKGHYAKCPTTAAAASPCRDKTTKKFAKCSAPNTEPVPAKK
jgi:hypothetical protein